MKVTYRGSSSVQNGLKAAVDWHVVVCSMRVILRAEALVCLTWEIYSSNYENIKFTNSLIERKLWKLASQRLCKIIQMMTLRFWVWWFIKKKKKINLKFLNAGKKWIVPYWKSASKSCIQYASLIDVRLALHFQDHSSSSRISNPKQDACWSLKVHSTFT